MKRARLTSFACKLFLFYALAIPALLGLSSCAWLRTMVGFSPPPTVQVEGWSSIEIVLTRLDKLADPTPVEFIVLRSELADPDGDGKMLAERLGFLVRPITFPHALPEGAVPPFSDPLHLYTVDVLVDTTLSPSGVSARVFSANRIRESIKEILDD